MGKHTRISAPATAALTAFEEQLRLALRHLHDASWLREASPLAAQHFLSLLPAAWLPDPVSDRGAALQQALRRAARGLWGNDAFTSVEVLAARAGEDEARYSYLVLDLNYFHEHVPAELLARYGHAIPQSVLYNDVLHISRASHDRHLQSAVRALARRMLDALRSPLLEPLVDAPVGLHGRAAALEACLTGLAAGQTMNVIGAAGTGKTALAATIAARWPGRAVLFCTCRPNINTNLGSVFMMLAQFLQAHGAPALMSQLLADGGAVRDAQLALGLARHDLGALGKTVRPLICVDDADVLTQPDLAADAEPVRVLLDALRGSAAMVLTGQRAAVSADIDITLQGLAADDAGSLLRSLGWTLDAAMLNRIELLTGGNPRLLVLLAHMRQSNESLDALLQRLPASPSLASWVARALARLPDGHAALLQAVATFERPAPLDAFGPQQPLLAQLAAQGWCEARQGRTISMAGAMRAAVLAPLSAQDARELQRFAARAHAERGDATAAADHYVRADEHEQAILAWTPNAESEIRRGQAYHALQILSRIPAGRLTKTFAEPLAVALARLQRARGAAPETIAAAGALGGRATPSLLLVDALQHAGWGHEQTGDLEQAMLAYTRSQQTVERLLARRVTLAASRASLAVRRRDMSAAQQEALRARFEAERMQGIVYDEGGALDMARTHFQNALILAEALNDESAIAFTCNSLGIVAGRQADGATARRWLARASAGFEKLGNLLQAETVRSNEAALLTTLGDYAGAIEAGERALAFFIQTRHTRMIAATAASVADACSNLGRHDAAVRFAELVIAQEETQFVPYGLYTLAEVRAALGDASAASALLHDGLKLARQNHDRYIEAYLLRKQGAVLTVLGEQAAANAQLARAAELFEQMGMHSEAAACGATQR